MSQKSGRERERERQARDDCRREGVRDVAFWSSSPSRLDTIIYGNYAAADTADCCRYHNRRFRRNCLYYLLTIVRSIIQVTHTHTYIYIEGIRNRIEIQEIDKIF